LPGWSESTVGLRQFDELPKTAQHYLKRIEEICSVPIDLVSTGPDRDQTIVRHHPYD
jgi:adenylosuccinate synthase